MWELDDIRHASTLVAGGKVRGVHTVGQSYRVGRRYRIGDTIVFDFEDQLVVARDQGVPVKVFTGASAGVAMLRWQDVAVDDTEGRLSQLCRWVVEADASGLRYGLSIPGVDIPPDSGDGHRERCLEAIVHEKAVHAMPTRQNGQLARVVSLGLEVREHTDHRSTLEVSAHLR